MAQITLDIPNDKVSDLVAAIESAFGRNEGEGDLAMAKRYLISNLIKVHRWHKGRVAKIAAELSTEDEIEIT